MKHKVIIFIFLMTTLWSCSRKDSSKDFLLRFSTNDGSMSGYLNQKGDTIIVSNGDFQFYTDTLKVMATAYKKDCCFVGINKKQDILFEIYPFDNGPDYPKEGFFRILKNKKIGFADLNGNIIIEPQFKCAYPFNNGKARVSMDCITVNEDEHSSWESKSWYYIDKKGRKVN